MLMEKRRGSGFARGLKDRRPHVAYWTDQVNDCPSCGRTQWLVGRVSAECAFCGTALPFNRGVAPTVSE